MIIQLDNTNHQVAYEMKAVFNDSYAIEAKLLKAKEFPPLKRTLIEYMETDTVFYGFMCGEKLSAIVEIRSHLDITHIQSLVVSPPFFRQGIAAKLMTFVLENYQTKIMFVETGVDNIPAILLYEKCGFKQVEEWHTDCGIRKVKLVK